MKGDGLFVDCRSYWKGRIGRAAMSFAKYSGGGLSIGLDGADQAQGLERALLQIGLRLRLVCQAEEGAADSGQEVVVVLWPVGPGSADVPTSAGGPGGSAVVLVVSEDVREVPGDVQADLAVVRPSRRRDLRRQLLDEWPASMPSGAS